jgi:signal transduction histidine kinase
MNRLWVRISLTLVSIIVFIVVVPLIFGVGRQSFDFDDNRSFPGHELWERIFGIELENEEDESGRGDDESDHFAPVPGIFIVESIFEVLVLVTVVALLAGILFSRSMTRPLDDLAEGARALAGHDLSRRVPEKGSAEIRSAARAFNEMAGELEHAETLRQNLLADVAHELRTPLTVLQGNLRAILDDVYEMDKQEIARLYDQTRHLSRLVEDLRDLAQAEARQLVLNKVPVEIEALVRDAGVNFASLAQEAGLTLETDIQPNLPNLQVDRARLIQSLHNLMDNALRHTPEGGHITLGAQAEAAQVSFTVRDTGAGLPADQLDQVFDRLYRSDAARTRDTGGAGLGLAIVKAIIELHNGEVWAESDGIGQGSTFGIRLDVG